MIGPLPFERRDELRLGTAYGFAWDEGALESGPDPDFDAVYEAERTRCAFDGDEVVGTLGAFSLEMTVPGAVVPTAGTTAITVRPTHRRRGLLRGMMQAHFEEIRERGEPLSALWASESSIYRRFGYGEAALLSRERIARPHTALLPSARVEAGRCRMVDRDEAQARMPGIYDRARRERPGMMARCDAWWRHRVLADRPYQRHGGTPLRRIVYERDGEPRGYLLYRMRHQGEAIQLLVIELCGVDGEAESALYQLACGVDLVEELVFWNQPADSPLALRLADPRRLQRVVRDALWLRLMDVGAALSARSYAAEGRLRLEVRDAFWSDAQGCYRLEASGGGGRCERCREEPDLALDVADLAAAYLGGISFRSLARAGRARGSAEALARADALFATPLPPYNPEIF